MKFLFFMVCVFVCGNSALKAKKDRLARIETNINRETTNIKSEISELWNAIGLINSSNSCACRSQKDSSEENVFTKVKSARGIARIDTKPATNDENPITTEQGEHQSVVLVLDKMDIFEEFVDEKLDKFEQIIDSKLELTEQAFRKKLSLLNNKVYENFVDIRNDSDNKFHNILQLLNNQAEKIANNEARIAQLEKALENITSLFLERVEARTEIQNAQSSPSSSPIPVTQCLLDWVLFGNTCYFVSKRKTDWFSAVDECSKIGGKLAEPSSSEQVQFIANLAKGTRIWIGVTDRFSEGTYIWESSKQPVQNLPWEPGQPNNFLIDQDCVEIIDTQPLFNDKPCFAEDKFVCEFNPLT